VVDVVVDVSLPPLLQLLLDIDAVVGGGVNVDDVGHIYGIH
jgi:hypothetical protein